MQFILTRGSFFVQAYQTCSYKKLIIALKKEHL